MCKVRLSPGYQKIDQADLPLGWSASALGTLVSVIQGGRLGLTKDSNYVSTGYPAFSAAGQDGFVDIAEYHNQKAVILSAIGANCGRCFYAEGDWTTLANVQAILPKSDLDAKFLYYRVNTDNYWTRSGSAQPFIKPSSIKSSWIAFPSVGFQEKIAEILTTIDAEIEQTEALIAKWQKIKAGMMQDLFRRGVTPEGRLRPTYAEAPDLYKESPLGWIPKEWNTRLLDDLATRGSGHTPNKNHPDYWNGGIKWISLADSWRLDRLFISETDKEISKKGIENSSAVIHPSGIVVLSRDAGVGKSAITTCPMAVSQHFMCWNCGTELDRYYLYYWLQDRKREFENIATGSTIPTIGLRFFKHYRINIPTSIEEQRQMGKTLLAIDQTIFGLEAAFQKLTSIKSGLMRDLLTGRVRVAVDGEEKDAA